VWCWVSESDGRGSVGCATDNTWLFACEVLPVIGGEVDCEIGGVLPSIEFSLLQERGVRWSNPGSFADLLVVYLPLYVVGAFRRVDGSDLRVRDV
jgi:hypothetical protein